MNIHADVSPAPSTLTASDAADALAALRSWAAGASAHERRAVDPALDALLRAPADAAYPSLSRSYPDLRVDAQYRATLPDLQNGPASLIKGARRRIQHVGISNFRVPLRLRMGDGTPVTLQASVTGSVSLEADAKGINMSRIMRSFYAAAEQHDGLEVADAVIDAYLQDLGSLDARLMLRFSLPLQQTSLRSDLTGWQYYDVSLEVLQQRGKRLRLLHLDYVYSSTCPCSLELSEHARETRAQLATPHSQRSVARLSVVIDPSEPSLLPEDLVEIARRAVVTETQVMVKREDEQAFAELNAANPIFVEDAARLFAEALQADARVGDFRVVASHQESLHSHDAVSVLTEGDTFASASLEPHLFASLIHRG